MPDPIDNSGGESTDTVVPDEQDTLAGATDTVPGGTDTVDDSNKDGQDTVSATDLLSDDEVDGDPDGDGAKDGDGEGPPDEYQLNLPDGVELTEEQKTALGPFNTLAKEVGLTQEAYDKLLDFDMKRADNIVESVRQQNIEHVNDWAAAVQADPVIGGDNLQTTLANAKAARAALSEIAPELVPLLAHPGKVKGDAAAQAMGLGNHPGMVKLLSWIGANLADDKLENGDAVATGEGDKLAKMYPSMKT